MYTENDQVRQSKQDCICIEKPGYAAQLEVKTSKDKQFFFLNSVLK